MKRLLLQLDPLKARSLNFIDCDGIPRSLRIGKPFSINEEDWGKLKNFCSILDGSTPVAQANVLNILTRDGIGDIHWVFLKLGILKKTAGAEKLVLHLSRVKGRPDRALDFVLMNPVVDEAAYVNITPNWSKGGVLAGEYGYDYVLSANTVLETGGKIEDWFPNLAVDYNYPMKLPVTSPLDYVVIYPGDHTASENWAGKWGIKEWADLINHVASFANVAVAGLECDKGFVDKIFKMGVDAKNLVGKTTWDEVYRLVMGSALTIGSVSGLTIFTAARGANTIVLWPGGHSKLKLPVSMRTAWIKDAPNYFPVGYDLHLNEVIEIVNHRWREGNASQSKTRKSVTV